MRPVWAIFFEQVTGVGRWMSGHAPWMRPLKWDACGAVVPTEQGLSSAPRWQLISKAGWHHEYGPFFARKILVHSEVGTRCGGQGPWSG